MKRLKRTVAAAWELVAGVDEMNVTGCVALALITAGAYGRWGWEIAALVVGALLALLYVYVEVVLPHLGGRS